ncbi:hypothetical protein [Pseudoalteromonas sp. T1lg88]|uniref:hypothetical protein n=1 Tax=Pseudoalteromonas sp. T1lg88 TaxID=2077104 RepID=UPI000CF6F108|nr:hypothetical protein [Pseudoalteromonas sp. T1lg88]
MVKENDNGFLATLSKNIQNFNKHISEFNDGIEEFNLKKKQETAEGWCRMFDLKYPTGGDLKGEDAVAVSEIAQIAFRNNDWSIINKLKDAGVLHK